MAWSVGRGDTPPSLSVSADCLEDRQLLATGLGKGPVAAIASPRGPVAVKASLGTSAAVQVVISQYESILLRPPTAGEVNAWVPALGAGAISKAGLRNSLLNSSERQQLLVNAGVNLLGSPASFVRSLYANLLHEIPSAAGSNQWVRKINAGMNREMVAQTFIDMAQHRGIAIAKSTFPPTTPLITNIAAPAPTPIAPPARRRPLRSSPIPVRHRLRPRPRHRRHADADTDADAHRRHPTPTPTRPHRRRLPPRRPTSEAGVQGGFPLVSSPRAERHA